MKPCMRTLATITTEPLFMPAQLGHTILRNVPVRPILTARGLGGGAFVAGCGLASGRYAFYWNAGLYLPFFWTFPPYRV